MTEETNGIMAKLPMRQTVLITALTALTAAFAVFIGSVIFMCIAGVLFALMLCRRAAAAWAAAPVSYLLSLLAVQDPVRALAALLFIAVGVPLAICIKRKATLSCTTASLTAASAIVFAVMLTVTVTGLYGGGIADSFKSYIADIKASFSATLAAVKTITDDNGFIIFTDQVISELEEMLLMSLPAVLIIVCEVIGYVSAKLFLLICALSKSDGLIERPWKMRASAATFAVFVVSYTVFLFAPRGVVYYSAENLMLILMPFTAVSGFHAMFGVGSDFRTSQRAGTKIMMIVTCAVFFFISPLLLLATLSFWGAFDMLRSYIRKKISSRRDG